MGQQCVGIGTITPSAKNDGNRGQGGRRLARQVAAGATGADLVGGPRHRHDLRWPPPGVILATIADLAIEFVGRGVRFDKIVGHPAQVVEQMG